MTIRSIALFTLLASPALASASCVDLTRTLKVGSTSDDVRALQIFLNESAATRIADSGAGSPGNESRYFGPATSRALARFQDKYADDILTPVGLTRGNGLLGARTRDHIRALTCDITSNTGATTNTTTGSLTIPILGNDLKADDADIPDLAKVGSLDDIVANANEWAKTHEADISTDAIGEAFRRNLKEMNARDRENARKNFPLGRTNRFSGVQMNLQGIVPPEAWPGMTVSALGFGFGTTNTVEIDGQKLETFGVSANGLLLPFVLPDDISPGNHVIKITGGISSGEIPINILSTSGSE